MKKHTKWNTVKEVLTTRDGPADGTERETFWSEFQARASLMNQDDAVPARPRPPLWGWVTAAACMLLVVGGLSYSWIASPAPLSSIDSVEVIASHGALLIMEDQESQSTMLWVVDMQPGDAS